jgi:hypothetical protein
MSRIGHRRTIRLRVQSKPTPEDAVTCRLALVTPVLGRRESSGPESTETGRVTTTARWSVNTVEC